jgi:HPr kinase/phosphorylase
MPELMEAAVKHDVTLLASDLDTSEFMGQLIVSLRRHLAPRVTLHGVLMEVHGEGLLITGDSGVGKSETALALLKRGHRLIADDAVEVMRTSRTTLVGTAPEIIRYYMELRGIGVIDARHIFGIGAVKPSQVINLVVNFEIWDNDKNYDRLGIETEYTEILGVRVPYNNIPVRPGRNLAAILELAAMNNREKSMGYNAARSLVEKHDRMLEEQRRKNGT